MDAGNFADVVNGDDVGMIQSGNRTRFLFEAAEAVGVISEKKREES